MKRNINNFESHRKEVGVVVSWLVMLGVIDKLNLREVDTVIVGLQYFLKLKERYRIIEMV